MNIVVLFYLVLTVMESDSIEVPFSPCPGLFSYFYNTVWMGRLTVPVPRGGLPVFAQVVMSLKAALQSRYVGLIELSDPVEIAVDNIVNLGANIINYTVRFPLPYPIPSLALVRVNNETVCFNNEIRYGLITDLYYEHTFPTNNLYLDNQLNGKQEVIHMNEPIPEEMCGHKSSTSFVDFTTLTGFGEWPWLAAILLENSRGLEFHCTGNLLTEKHVITAAHCVKTRHGRQYAPRKFIVYLGKYDLTKWHEANSQVRNVENIVIHPEYLQKLYSSDLAVMVLEEPVVLNYYVRPVCIWRDGPSLSSSVGRYGAVVGWGRDPEKGTLNPEPRMFFLPIVGQEECLRSRRDYFYVTSGNTFCAGLRNGTGPCNGDSGSGLILPQTDLNNQTVWYLRGIISLSLLDPYKQTCDLRNYLVFTDIAKFTDWISETIDTTYE